MTGITFLSIQLTLWSFRGGRTIVLSMVFSTIFHSSFRTRFSTVFSQILAKSIKLQKQCLSVQQKHSSWHEERWHPRNIQREEHLRFAAEKQRLPFNLTIVQTGSPGEETRGRILFFFYISLRGFPLIPHWPQCCFDKLFREIPRREEWNVSFIEGNKFSRIDDSTYIRQKSALGSTSLSLSFHYIVKFQLESIVNKLNKWNLSLGDRNDLKNIKYCIRI